MCPTDDLCVTDDTYLSCVADVRRDLIISTAAVSALASFLMGLLANLPVGMAPGLGLNAYVSFTWSLAYEMISHVLRDLSSHILSLGTYGPI